MAYNAGIDTLVAICHWWDPPDTGRNSLPPTKSEFNICKLSTTNTSIVHYHTMYIHSVIIRGLGESTTHLGWGSFQHVEFQLALVSGGLHMPAEKIITCGNVIMDGE